MISLLHKTSLLILLSLIINVINAQSSVHIGHIGSEDGLTSQLCVHIVEDDFGNLWISSFRDLQKYNGYSVTKIDLGQEVDYQTNDLNNLWKDQLGNIWMIQGEFITQENPWFWNLYNMDTKIDIINPLTNELIEFSDYIGTEEIKSKDIVKILMHNEKVFLCTKDNIIYSFRDELKYFSKVDDLKNLVTINKNNEIVLLENETLLTKDSTGQVVHQTSSQFLSNYEFLVTNASGEIFLISEIKSEISVDEFDKNKIEHLGKLDKNEMMYNPNIYNKIKKFDDNQVLINGRLFIKNEKQEYNRLIPGRSKYINEYFISQNGLGYAATNLGVYIINNKKLLFKKLGFDFENKNSVRGIFFNNNFISHKVYDREILVDKTKNNQLDFLKNRDLGYMSYGHYLDPQNKNHFWSFGLIPGRARKIDFQNKRIDTISFDKPFLVNTMLRSPLTSVLYASSDLGPLTINEEEMLIQSLSLDTLFVNGIRSNHIIERNNEIWFATSEGVLKYNEENKEARFHKIFDNNISLTIQFLHEDKNNPNLVWLGTRKGGLIKWNTNSDSIQIFNTANGLSNNDVHAIIEDNSNRLWISTNRYLNCFNKNNNQISIFTEQDGLSDSEFNRHSFFYDKNENEIYFGGLNGYNFFNPDSISTSGKESIIDVRIIDAVKIKNDGKSENIFFGIIESNTIDFYNEDLSLEIDLSTNYLFDNEKAQFSYRIPKLSQEWKTQNSNILKLNRLPYGKFEVDVISNLNKPSFTSNILTLEVNVIKPFWKTWLFYVLLVLGSALIVWWSIKKYFQILNDRNIRLEKEVKTRTEELRESNSTKSKLFAILAHDLRNPISSLSNLSGKIKFLSENNRLDELEIMAKTTDAKLSSLNDNLNNILLWAVTESNLTGMKSEKVLLKDEINKINELYEEAISEKNIKLVNRIPESYHINCDITVLQTILRNLINNAIKYSYPGGQIQYLLEEEKSGDVLKIIDSGIGLLLTENEPVKNSAIRKAAKGSGIGLKLCRELATKANLELDLVSNPKGGAIGIIRFDKI